MATAQASAGVITLTQRESVGRNELFAGSGGAVQTRIIPDGETSLTGAFSFNDSGQVAVNESDPFSTGSASASGAINAQDNVTQLSPAQVSMTVVRSSSGTANKFTGPSLANSLQRHKLRVRFETGADPVEYSLTGDFDPGLTTGRLGEAGAISLYRPFTAIRPFRIDTATTGINLTGTLPANQTYEFLVNMADAISQGTVNSDASSANLVFTLTSVPEPASALLLSVVALVFARRR